MKKIILALLIALSIAIIMTACSNEVDYVPIIEESEEVEEVEEIEEPEPLTSAEIGLFQAAVRQMQVSYDEIDRKYAIFGAMDITTASREAGFLLQLNVLADGRAGFGFIITYRGDGWIFFDEIVLAIDEERITISNISPNEKATDIIRGSTVSEHYAIRAEYVIPILEQIADANAVTIRLRGDRTVDGELTAQELTNISIILRIHDMLQQHPELVNYIEVPE